MLDSAGGVIGRTESLLGDEAEGMLHGLAVKRRHDGRLVEITEGGALVPPRVAGLFRKHPRWDSASGT